MNGNGGTWHWPKRTLKSAAVQEGRGTQAEAPG
jgi:hypothetical protein